MENAFLIFIMGAMCGVLLCGFIILLAAIFAPDKEQKPELTDEQLQQMNKAVERKPVVIAQQLEEQAKHIERVSQIRYLCSLGMSQRDIAKTLHMAQSCVCRIMQKYGIKKADK